MTISSTSRVAGPFIGDGTTATFPFTFKVFDPADLYVVELDLATGELFEPSGPFPVSYIATLNADQNANPGGSILLAGGNLPDGFSLTITTDMAELQDVDLTNGGGFYPDVINDALDTQTIFAQQLQEQLDRAIQTPLPDTGESMVLPPAAQRAGKVLGFDAMGNLQLVPIAGGGGGGGGVPAAQSAAGVVNGVNTIFTFVAAAGSTPVILVYAGGLFQTPSTDYGVPVFVSGTTWRLTFVNAPTQGPITVVVFA